jgi:GAF domain-containing protein
MVMEMLMMPSFDYGCERSQRVKNNLASAAEFEPRWERSLLLAQAEILELVATGTEPLSMVLARLCKLIEALSCQARCSILLLNPSGTKLTLGAAPSFPDHYQQILSQGIPTGERQGSCGTAAYRKQSVTTVDVKTDPNWKDYRDIPLQSGVRAYWSTPIWARNREVLGTFAMVHAQPSRPRPRDQQLIQLATHLAGIAIERQRADQAIQAQQQHLSTLNTDLERQVQARTAQLQLAFDFEATLRRITDKVRDSLDEDQIMETAVRELAQAIGVICCDASLYTPEQQTKTIHYEYIQREIGSAKGTVLSLEQDTAFHQQIMQGQTFQCCFLASAPHLIRKTAAQMAVLICPLMDDRGVLGELWLFKSRAAPFEELEIRLSCFTSKLHVLISETLAARGSIWKFE